MRVRPWDRRAARPQCLPTEAVQHLAQDWRDQAAHPVQLLDLVTITRPIRIVTRRRAPADIRSLVRLLRLGFPDVTSSFVASAKDAAHLPKLEILTHLVANFVVSADLDCQNVPSARDAA